MDRDPKPQVTPLPELPAQTGGARKPLNKLILHLEEAGFCFMPGAEMRANLAARDPAWDTDWQAFASSWGDLALDRYMADGGRYRRRRYATLSAAPAGEVAIEPHQPHYQSLDYNRLNGGVARYFEPILDSVLAGPTLQAVIGYGRDIFAALHPEQAAHIEVHQFRIEARLDAAGRPTPEGIHRDGVDFVLVMMVRRENVESGTTETFDLGGNRLAAFTLTDPGDAALVDDQRALHGVTPIVPRDPTQPAWRDVLVVTYRRKPLKPDLRPQPSQPVD
ncbi:MAG: hypothetical protein FGM40_06155 [Rhodocyclaceae bacterium]|nr:hypothetical protein [Rhodocyclaceae bacterium]